MISGIFHQGSGLGNQLHRYVATRVLALDKGYDFCMIAPEHFKGSSFMDLDTGKPANCIYRIEEFSGKVIPYTKNVTWDVGGKNIQHHESDLDVWNEKTNYYNPDFNFIEDKTILDGEFQDERYFKHRLPEIDQWLQVKPLEVPDDVCVIGFRGGEFYVFPELGLPKEYFDKGIEMMKEKGITKFEVHTDDEELAKKFFPEYKVIHDIGINWRSMRYAKHAIIANSSFYILPRLLRHFGFNGSPTSKDVVPVTIAPRYWARRNTKEWSMPQNYYKSFMYI